MEMKDYEIKMDGEFHQFEGGGVRYTKTGKGRFDLLPQRSISDLINHLPEYVNTFFLASETNITQEYLMLHSYSSAINLNIINSIFDIVALEFLDDIDHVTIKDFFVAFMKMLRQLAVHYEKGAEKYGENNWKKGIPENSFMDSGLRHLTQYLSGENDEPHAISAIWNFCCWLYVFKDENE